MIVDYEKDSIGIEHIQDPQVNEKLQREVAVALLTPDDPKNFDVFSGAIVNLEGKLFLMRSAVSLLTIINDILDISKIEAGKLTIEAVPFDLYHCIEHTLKTLMWSASEKQLTLLTKITPDVLKVNFGDPVRVPQILLNLAAIPSNSPLTVK